MRGLYAVLIVSSLSACVAPEPPRSQTPSPFGLSIIRPPDGMYGPGPPRPNLRTVYIDAFHVHVQSPDLDRGLNPPRNDTFVARFSRPTVNRHDDMEREKGFYLAATRDYMDRTCLQGWTVLNSEASQRQFQEHPTYRGQVTGSITYRCNPNA